MKSRISFSGERLTITSSKSLDDVASAIESQVGRPFMPDFFRRMSTAKTFVEVQQIVSDSIHPTTGLMEFARFDQGRVLRLANGEKWPRTLRLLIGNPLVMRKLVEQLPHAGGLAPTTVLIDEQPDGSRISYDLVASELKPYNNPIALQVAEELDAKIEALLTKAAE